MTDFRLTRRTGLKAAFGALLIALVSAFAAPQAARAEQPETVCIKCHSSLPDKLGAPVKAWRTSVHAESGISCNSCHGGDPKDEANAMDRTRGFLGAPKETDIPAFCGRCHPGILKDYLASAHGHALGKGGPTCVTCHTNHSVQRASLSLINEKTCTQCHTFERAQAIRDAMQQTETTILGIDRRIKLYQAQGVDTEKLGKTLFNQRNRFHTLFHTQDVGKVKSESTQINAELAKVDQTLKAVEEARAQRKKAGVVVIAFLLVMAALAHFMKKTYD